MFEKIQKYLSDLLRLEDQYVLIATYIVSILIIFIICIVVDIITKKILMRAIKKIVDRTANKADEIFYEKKVFHQLAHIAPALVVYLFALNIPNYTEFIQSITFAYIMVIVALVCNKALDAMVEIYRQKEYAKNRPIKGFIQVIKIMVVIFTGLFVLVIFTGDDTAKALLGGIGGMSAILILIFRDSILGLVAGIQLSSDNLLKIGDWIEMPQYKADGEVVDISLTKITVRNWDKTYTTIPAHKFLDESFVNWEGMSQSGGRRIKRSIYIDITSISFLSDEQIEKISKIKLLKKYLTEKQYELQKYNEANKINSEDYINARKLTNIGTFRAYALEYISNHPAIHKTYIQMIRQLASTEKGLPLEIYCFTNTTAWTDYESIQADIFDHLFSILEEFGLRVYQSPSSADFKAFQTKG